MRNETPASNPVNTTSDIIRCVLAAKSDPNNASIPKDQIERSILQENSYVCYT